MSHPADPDAYIAAAPEAFRPVLARLRARLAEALPEAQEVVAYGMPGFRIADMTVAGYAAFSRSCGLYLPAQAIAACADEIAAAGLKATKTGVTFTAKTPLPDALLAQLVAAARAAVQAKAAG